MESVHYVHHMAYQSVECLWYLHLKKTKRYCMQLVASFQCLDIQIIPSKVNPTLFIQYCSVENFIGIFKLECYFLINHWHVWTIWDERDIAEVLRVYDEEWCGGYNAAIWDSAFHHMKAQPDTRTSTIYCCLTKFLPRHCMLWDERLLMIVHISKCKDAITCTKSR